MTRKVRAGVVAALLFVVVIVVGRTMYRESRFWQYDAYRWKCDCANESCVRGRSIGSISNNVIKLVNAMNRSDKDPESFRAPGDKEPWLYAPKIKVVGQRGSVVDVEVINDFALTQSMGTCGADTFIAETTFILTENPSVREVNLLFQEGDHAAPGQYSRELLQKKWKMKL